MWAAYLFARLRLCRCPCDQRLPTRRHCSRHWLAEPVVPSARATADHHRRPERHLGPPGRARRDGPRDSHTLYSINVHQLKILETQDQILKALDKQAGLTGREAMRSSVLVGAMALIARRLRRRRQRNDYAFRRHGGHASDSATTPVRPVQRPAAAQRPAARACTSCSAGKDMCAYLTVDDFTAAVSAAQRRHREQHGQGVLLRIQGSVRCDRRHRARCVRLRGRDRPGRRLRQREAD
jgi:hypothetical protein